MRRLEKMRAMVVGQKHNNECVPYGLNKEG